MLTALLICMENTFWNISRGDDFVKLFKKSFALYVESGIKKKTEAGLDILRKELKGARGHSVTVSKDFKEKFYMFIMEQYLREFHCFYIFFSLDLTMIFCPNTAHP